MKSNSYPVIVCKKVYDIVYTGGKEKRHETKTTQYFLPNIDIRTIWKALKILLLFMSLLTILCFPDKIKEAAPIITSVLEQLH